MMNLYVSTIMMLNLLGVYCYSIDKDNRPYIRIHKGLRSELALVDTGYSHSTYDQSRTSNLFSNSKPQQAIDENIVVLGRCIRFSPDNARLGDFNDIKQGGKVAQVNCIIGMDTITGNARLVC